MKIIQHGVKWIMIVAVVGLMSAAVTNAAAQPLKVYILAGQSNMQGHVNISTFASMADNPKTAPILKEMLNADGKPKVCRNVWISSIGCAGNDTTEQKGRLTAGFGASPNDIGPEFTFGIYIEKLLGGPILIIKTSWGGRDLCTDFRPPSAGPFVWGKYELDQLKRGGHDLKKAKADEIKATGVYYRLMIQHVRKVLANIKRVDPEYNPKQGYELAGFVWFQGWNDMVGYWTYPKGGQPGGFNMYGQLLTQFIKNVRKDLAAPHMPFVIGVMGVGGMHIKPGRKMYFRQAEVEPTLLPEFKGNVTAVQTAPFWDDKLAALVRRMNGYWPKVDAKVAAQKNTSWKNKMRIMAQYFTPAEWRHIQGASAPGFHYLGSAGIMAPIGKAFAQATAKLDRIAWRNKTLHAIRGVK